MAKILRVTVGWLFLVAGVLGLFLPLLQGILFIAVGCALLAKDSPFFRKILQRLKRRFPRLEKSLRTWQQKLQSFFKQKKN